MRHTIRALSIAGALSSLGATAQNPVIGVIDVQMKPSQTFNFAIHKGITLYTIGQVPANLRVRVINASKEDLLHLREDHDKCVTLATNIIVTGLGYSGSIQLNPIDNDTFLPAGKGENATATLTLIFEALDSPEQGVIRIKKKDLPTYLGHALQITLTGTSPVAAQNTSAPSVFLPSPKNPPSPDCYVVRLADNAPIDGSPAFTLVALATPAGCEEAAVPAPANLQGQHQNQTSVDGGIGADR